MRVTGMTDRLRRGCLTVFVGAVLLTWTVQLLRCYWWALVAVGLLWGVGVLLRWYHQRW